MPTVHSRQLIPIDGYRDALFEDGSLGGERQEKTTRKLFCCAGQAEDTGDRFVDGVIDAELAYIGDFSLLVSGSRDGGSDCIG